MFPRKVAEGMRNTPWKAAEGSAEGVYYTVHRLMLEKKHSCNWVTRYHEPPSTLFGGPFWGFYLFGAEKGVPQYVGNTRTFNPKPSKLNPQMPQASQRCMRQGFGQVLVCFFVSFFWLGGGGCRAFGYKGALVS